VCLQAKCGDGVVQAGVEECDGFDLDLHTCASFGLQDPGRTACAARPRAPSIPAGADRRCPRLPHPATHQPPPTPTPTMLGCGNGILESGETCDDCPADCEVLDCPQTPVRSFKSTSRRRSDRAPRW
jgi:hypothetical protein